MTIDSCRKLVEAVERYLRSISQGVGIIKQEGVDSMPFRAHVDQSAAALVEMKEAVKRAREEIGNG